MVSPKGGLEICGGLAADRPPTKWSDNLVEAVAKQWIQSVQDHQRWRDQKGLIYTQQWVLGTSWLDRSI